MDAAIVQSGKFTATGAAKNLSIRSDLDWMYVYNYTVLSAAGADTGAQFYWQRGMSAGTGIEYKKTAVTNALQIGALASGGFTLIDQGNQAYVSSAVATTGISNATQPVVSTGSTAGLSAGDIVILSQTSAQRTAADATALLGIPFQIDTIVANTSFRIANALSQAPGAGIAAAAGSWRKINTLSIFYPSLRYIVKIDVTAPLAPIVTTSVDHGYQVGQVVFFSVPSAVNGMVELDQLSGQITAVTASTFTVDIDTTGFTAFSFPTAVQAAAASPYTPASVSPAGMDTAQALSSSVNILSDATDNVAIIGMSLAAGVDSPAGAVNDVIYWVAGKSSYLQN